MHRDGLKGLNTEKNIDVLISELRVGLDSGANNILFSDSAISPRRFREISNAILDEGLKFEWWCFIRAERGFDDELFSLGYKAGCREVNIGVESINNRIANMMNKGIHIETISQVIKSASDSGIETIIDMLVGFPTETIAECEENIKFLEENISYITQIGANIFSAWKGTEISLNHERYGIFIFDNPNSLNPEIAFEVNKIDFPNATTKNEILFMAGKMNLLNKRIESVSTPVKEKNYSHLSNCKIFKATYDWSKVTQFQHTSEYFIAEFQNGRLAILE